MDTNDELNINEFLNDTEIINRITTKVSYEICAQNTKQDQENPNLIFQGEGVFEGIYWKEMHTLHQVVTHIYFKFSDRDKNIKIAQKDLIYLVIKPLTE